jgi:hypothetical protein
LNDLKRRFGDIVFVPSEPPPSREKGATASFSVGAGVAVAIVAFWPVKLPGDSFEELAESDE